MPATPANALNINAAGIVKFDGTATFSADTVTQHDVLIGGSANAITSVAPSATTGVALVSQGAAADPAFGTVVVAGGGTGQVTLTNHGVLVGAGTSAITQLAVGSNGQVLIGATTADPAFATLTSSDSSISFTTGVNTLSLQVAGGSTAIKTITGNSGGAESPSAGNFNVLGTGSITVAGTANTETVQLTGLTNHNVLIGAGTATITNVAPSATSGVPLISQGVAADPAFGTAVVAGGGTGLTSATAYAVLTGGTTTTGAFQSIASVGTTGQVLTSNGAGALPTFQTAGSSGFTTVVIQTFTSSGTYTPTASMKYCTMQSLGGGGAGGGAATTSGAQFSVGGGGGSGEYAVGVFSAATIGASQTVTIGAAGTANSGATGGNGGNTSVGALISANGGSGGVTVAAFSTNGTAAGGAGGTGGSGGSYRTPGQHGGFGFGFITTNANPWSGNGGNSQIGAGGFGAAGNGGGNAGLGFGSGGAGLSNSTSQSAGAGGAGTAGIVVVTEFI